MADSDSKISLEEYRAWEEISYAWAYALDGKDWDLLRSIIAPTITTDYTSVFGWIDTDIPAGEYVAKCSNPDVLGIPHRKGQHLFGAATLKKLSSTRGTAQRQMKAQNYLFDPETKQQVANANGYGTLQFFYEKIETQWKLRAVIAVVDFIEGDMRDVYPTYPKYELPL